MKLSILKIIPLSLFLFCFTQASFAEKPNCPSVNALAAVGVSTAMQLGVNEWVAREPKNHYDTQVDWAFIIGYFGYAEKEALLKQARQAISTLHLMDNSPLQIGKKDSDWWMCEYQNNTGIMAIAFTPPEGRISL